jgi:hypothetical protein
MVLVAIDVGTSKVVALIGEVGRDGSLTIIGKGAPASAGIKKGAVINIDQVVGSITAAVEQAERLSGYKLESAFVSIGGDNVESQNSRARSPSAVRARRSPARTWPGPRTSRAPSTSPATARCCTSCRAATSSTARRASRIPSA